MITQYPVHCSGKNVPPPTYMEKGVTEMATALMDCAFETTSMAVQVTKFAISHHRYMDVLLRVYQISNPAIALRDMKCSRFLLCTIHPCVCGLDHARRILSVTTTARANYSEPFEAASSKATRVLVKPASVVLQDGRNRVQALHDLHKNA